MSASPPSAPTKSKPTQSSSRSGPATKPKTGGPPKTEAGQTQTTDTKTGSTANQPSTSHKGYDPRKKIDDFKQKYDPRARVNNLKKKYDPREKIKDLKNDFKKNAVKGVNKAADVATEKGARAIGDALGGWGVAAEQGMKGINSVNRKIFGDNQEALLVARVAEFAAPLLIPIAVAVFIFFIIFLIFYIIISIIFGSPAAGLEASPLTINISGPERAKNGDLLPYQINVAYPGTAQDVIITNHIPDGTDYVSSIPTATYDPATKTANWSIKSIIPPSADGTISNINTSLSITLRSTQDNTTLINMAQGVVIGEVTSSDAASSTGNSIGGQNPPQ